MTNKPSEGTTPQAERCPKCGSRMKTAYGQIMEPKHGAGTWPMNCNDPWHRAVAPVETRPQHAIDCEYQPKSAECDGIDCSCKETRLTAEQFWQTWIDTPLFEELSAKYSPDEWSKIACAFAEAFRDKSEANLLTVIKGYELREHQVSDDAFEQNAELREEIERLNKEIERLRGLITESGLRI